MFDKYNIASFMKTTGISFYENKSGCITENSRSSSGRSGYQLVRIYNSSRRLESYNLYVKFTAIHTSSGISDKRDKIIRENG